MSKQKVCDKGYSYGLTCINRERSCNKELTGQSIKLCSQLANLVTSKALTFNTEDLSGKNSDGWIEQGKNMAAFETVQIPNFSALDKINPVGISFTINGYYSEEGSRKMSEKEKIKMTLGVIKGIKSLVDKYPEGTVFMNQPYSDDNKYQKRIDTYKSFGFSSPNENNIMFAVKRGKKLEPVTLEQLQNFEKEI